MDLHVLPTKVRTPPELSHVVRRNRLVDNLEGSVPEFKLLLISAPAGYGKTTLLSQWAHSSRYPVAWLSLGREESNPDRFFRYLLASWETVQPGIRESPLGMLLGASTPDHDAVLAAIISAALELPEHLAIVLDDYHLIDDPAVHGALAFLLDHLPPTLHFVMAGRGEPPIPLARYRARHELLELGAGELRFQEAEASAFLSGSMGLAVDPAGIAALQGQTEGWIAGLQLAALALRRQTEPTAAHAVTGRQRFIADYLRDDVLRHLSGDVQQFLIETCLLKHLSASLCDAVTGREDSREMLALLERERIFLMPLDDDREWYRYHLLFADVLIDELRRQQPERIARLHRRAAGWYLAQGRPEDAFGHAVEAGDLELTIRICEQHLFVLLHNGEFRIINEWLAALPGEWFAAYPPFKLAQAGVLAYSGAVDACSNCVDEIEQMLQVAPIDDPQPHQARITAMRCFVACFRNDVERAEAHAVRALQELGDEDLVFRADTYHALGDTYRRNGRWDESRSCYLEILDLSRSPTFPGLSAHVFGALADLELRQGHRRAAAGYWNMALAAIESPRNQGSFPLPLVGWVYIRVAEMLYEENRLGEAWEHLSRGLDHAELGGDVRAITAGYLIACRLKLAEGDRSLAASFLNRARPLVEQARLTDWAGHFERAQLEVQLAHNQSRAVLRWAGEKLQDAALVERHGDEVIQLAIVRGLLVKPHGPAYEQALQFIERLLGIAEAEGRAAIMIEALALQSLALSMCGEHPRAMTSLQRALRMAEPEGYVRLFLDLGLPVVRLLQQARDRDVVPEYVAQLLAAAGAPANGTFAGKLPEPLTAREQEILQLLAAGLTNQEIGDQLFISAQTVKKHAGNIYGKLGVHTRTEAAARARDLALLDA